MRRAALMLLCLLGPLAGILVATPIAFLPLETWTMGGRVDIRQLLLGAPAYLGIAAAPGYVACTRTRKLARDLPPVRRWWIRASMATAIACSAAGVWAANLMWLFGPPSLVSLICAAYLWWRFERERVAHPGGTAST
jgi:hypothetical protein